VIRDVLAGHGDLRYVWRHLPLTIFASASWMQRGQL
jgi:hypothetical protein